MQQSGGSQRQVAQLGCMAALLPAAALRSAYGSTATLPPAALPPAALPQEWEWEWDCCTPTYGGSHLLKGET